MPLASVTENQFFRSSTANGPRSPGGNSLRPSVTFSGRRATNSAIASACAGDIVTLPVLRSPAASP